MRLLIIGTHPYQTTGYSKVNYNLLKYLQHNKDIQTTIFGIQKFTTENDKNRSDISNVFIWDVVKDDPQDFGFGTQSLKKFIIINQPDVVLVYNDANVIQKYIMNLLLIKKETKEFKIAVYLDQICDYQDAEIISYIYNNSSHIFCFTEYWKANIKKILPSIDDKRLSILKHGIHKMSVIDTIQAKLLLGFKHTDFIFLNLNRNMSRKRPDITIMAFALFLKNTSAQNAYLYMPNVKDNQYNLSKIFAHYLQLFGIDNVSNKNKLLQGEKVYTDDEINIIYNACDVGINTCQAEGFGLCNYEHASLGKPQILSKIGGLTDFFTSDNSIMCEPRLEIFDNTDGIQGNIKLLDYKDVAEAMEKYYNDNSLRRKHGEKCKAINDLYIWKNEYKKLAEVLVKL